MTPAQQLLTLVSVALACGCVALLVSAYRGTAELLTPWTMFLGMAVIDIYIPAALFFSVGLELPPWLSGVARDVTFQALLVFTAGALCFALGYAMADRGALSTHVALLPSHNRIVLLAAVVALAFFWGMAADVLAAGGVREYLSERLMNRFAHPTGQSGLASLLLSIRGSLVPILFVLAGAAFDNRRARPFLGFGLPVLAAGAAATLLLRGTLLTLLFGLAVVERSRLHDLEAAGSAGAAEQAHRINNRIVAVCVMSVTLFVAYGTVRNYLTQEAYSGRATIAQASSAELGRFVRGEGFVGLLGIIDAYPRDVPFMHGRTIRDMLLLPVPRALWPSKPTWYGIDDITRSMGWPASTMSAVTMPGELYANFSFWGIPLMWLYGWFFGGAHGHRFHPLFRYVYAFVIVPMMLPTFWMAFTGFVNQLVPVPLMMIALWFVFPQVHGERRLTKAAIA
jgi:hypothetical protein